MADSANSALTLWSKLLHRKRDIMPIALGDKQAASLIQHTLMIRIPIGAEQAIHHMQVQTT